MIWLIAWLVPAATLVQPLAKYVFALDNLVKPSRSREAVRWLGGSLLSLLWPYFVFMVLRKKLLLEVLRAG